MIIFICVVTVQRWRLQRLLLRLRWWQIHIAVLVRTSRVTRESVRPRPIWHCYKVMHTHTHVTHRRMIHLIYQRNMLYCEVLCRYQSPGIKLSARLCSPFRSHSHPMQKNYSSNLNVIYCNVLCKYLSPRINRRTQLTIVQCSPSSKDKIRL